MGRTLEARLGVVHVEVDRQHAGLVEGLEERRIERHEWIAAYQAAYKLVESALLEGRPVVFDAVSYRRVQRDRIKRIADKHGVPMTVIYLDVPPRDAKARIVANRANPVRVSVPSADFEEVAAGMQPPGVDERVLIYRPSEAVDEWVDRMIAPLLSEQPSR